MGRDMDGPIRAVKGHPERAKEARAIALLILTRKLFHGGKMKGHVREAMARFPGRERSRIYKIFKEWTVSSFGIGSKEEVIEPTFMGPGSRTITGLGSLDELSGSKLIDADATGICKTGFCSGTETS
jgi:hypothetical protein